MLPSDSTFFGLTPDYNQRVHEQIFELCYYGNGFTHSEVYKMPVNTRSFYYVKLARVLEQKKSAEEAAVAKSQQNKGKRY